MPASLSEKVDNIEKTTTTTTTSAQLLFAAFTFKIKLQFIHSGIETENNGDKNKRKRKVWFLS